LIPLTGRCQRFSSQNPRYHPAGCASVASTRLSAAPPRRGDSVRGSPFYEPTRLRFTSLRPPSCGGSAGKPRSEPPWCGNEAAHGDIHTQHERKARHADGRSGAASRRGGTVRFKNTHLATNRLDRRRRVNEVRGCDEKRVLPNAGEPKAIASTELPEA
jgi:hypothetical protein